MRVDLTLKYLCLVKSRSIAKSLCEKGFVLVDGRTVRPSAKAVPGNRITVRFRRRTLTFELLASPGKQLSKSAAVDYYRPVETPRADGESRREDGTEYDFDDFDLDDSLESQ